jgi:hypothetical protein
MLIVEETPEKANFRKKPLMKELLVDNQGLRSMQSGNLDIVHEFLRAKMVDI